MGPTSILPLLLFCMPLLVLRAWGGIRLTTLGPLPSMPRGRIVTGDEWLLLAISRIRVAYVVIAIFSYPRFDHFDVGELWSKVDTTKTGPLIQTNQLRRELTWRDVQVDWFERDLRLILFFCWVPNVENSSIFLTPRLVECDSACACWAMVIDSTWSRSRLTVHDVYGTSSRLFVLKPNPLGSSAPPLTHPPFFINFDSWAVSYLERIPAPWAMRSVVSHTKSYAIEQGIKLYLFGRGPRVYGLGTQFNQPLHGTQLFMSSVLPTRDSLISSSRLGPYSLNPVTHAASVGNSFLPPLLKVIYAAPSPCLSSSPSNSAKT
ncbi:hypothetical protein VNO77_19901 [Canavalia gladiata]|uniref:Uncharacterized protein n=1 Tax=Canavalia gladiata TaxID=3824 RepID=A0AAN9QIW8_CANGL